MEIRAFRVIAECLDRRSGRRFGIGDTFHPAPTVAQAQRLVAAGCLPTSAVEAALAIEENGGINPAEIVRAQLNHDGLFDKSMDELRQIVADEGIAPSEDEMKGQVVEVIRRHRTTRRSQIAPENVQMRTEAGELAARQADALAAGVGTSGGATEGVGTAEGVSGTTIAGGGAVHNLAETVDGLDVMTVERLRDIAETERLDLGAASRKADIIVAIRAHRAKV